jgi:hypothetical protein
MFNHLCSTVTYFKGKFNLCPYEIHNDGTLQYPDCHKEKIWSAAECEKNPNNCYEMIPNSPFGKTTKTLEFVKQTQSDESRLLRQHEKELVITKIIVPTGTQIHFENGDTRNDTKKRVAMAIVGDQYHLSDNKHTSHSYSFRDNKFAYITGSVVTPKDEFYDYEKWIKDGQVDVACKSGIHAFSNEYKAHGF